MDYNELIAIRKKEKKCNKIVACLTFPLFVALVTIMLCLILEVELNVNFLLATVIVGFVIGVITFIIGCRGNKYRKEMENYTISVIKDLIKMEGVEEDNFQIFCDKDNVYRVAFGNQKVDYDLLRGRTALVLSELNKVSGRNIKVILI